MAKIAGYFVYAMNSEGLLYGLGPHGWTTNIPKLFMTLSFARFAASQSKLPEGIIDAYIWSNEHEISLAYYIGELAIVPEALAMVQGGQISYENAEILHRLPFADWQLQLLCEARDCTPREFSDIVRGALRRLAV